MNRKLVIGDQTWLYQPGVEGIGIIDPRDGKRHNIRWPTFFLALGEYCVSYEYHPTATPGVVRQFIDRALLKTEPMPGFLVSVSHLRVGLVFTSHPVEKADRHMKALGYERKPEGSIWGPFSGFSRSYPYSEAHREYIYVREPAGDKL